MKMCSGQELKELS